LRFDVLEDRRVLSGNVTSLQAGINLTLSGDAAANRIAIIGTGTPGTFRVYSADGSTRIDGQLSKTFVGATGDLGIGLKEGADLLTMTNLTIGGSLGIDMGAALGPDGSADQTFLTNVNVNGAAVGGLALPIVGLGITTGAGNDLTLLTRVNVVSNLGIDAGAGTDIVSATISSFGSLAATATIDMGADGSADFLYLTSDRFNGTGAKTFNLGDGNNYFVSTASTYIGPVAVNSGTGNDWFIIPYNRFASAVIIHHGTGTDRIINAANAFAVPLVYAP